MLLTWYGTAALVFRENESEVAFDPFGGILPGELKHIPDCISNGEIFKNIRCVFVTHGHLDHIYHVPRLFSGTNSKIYCSALPAKTLRKEGISEKNIVTVAPGDALEAGSIRAKIYKGRHCRYDLPLLFHIVFSKEFFCHIPHLLRLLRLNMRFPEGGETLFWELEAGGCRVQVMGSLNLDSDTDYPTGADALILPFQGRSDLDTFAMDIVKRLRPKAVFLDHYDNTFPPLTDNVDTARFTEAVFDKLGIPCVALKRGETINLDDFYNGGNYEREKI